MIAVDTSVAVPAVVSWHERHDLASETVQGEGVRLVAHAAVEAFSVLTRLPERRALRPPDALTALRASFPGDPLALPGEGYDHLLEMLAEAGVGGGAVYDALVGASAAHAGARLLTLDRRALPVYRLVGADAQLLG